MSEAAENAMASDRALSCWPVSASGSRQIRRQDLRFGSNFILFCVPADYANEG
jgi:hypothetical protein